MVSILSRSVAFLKRILNVALPFGRGKFFVVVASMILQAILQLGGVASVLPFLSVAANPEGFATSKFGSFLDVHVSDYRSKVFGVCDGDSCDHRLSCLRVDLQ